MMLGLMRKQNSITQIGIFESKLKQINSHDNTTFMIIILKELLILRLSKSWINGIIPRLGGQAVVCLTLTKDDRILCGSPVTNCGDRRESPRAPDNPWNKSSRITKSGRGTVDLISGLRYDIYQGDYGRSPCVRRQSIWRKSLDSFQRRGLW